jgi:hypothetical protein
MRKGGAIPHIRRHSRRKKSVSEISLTCQNSLAGEISIPFKTPVKSSFFIGTSFAKAEATTIFTKGKAYEFQINSHSLRQRVADASTCIRSNWQS